jgi:hypothetical protein
LRLQAQRERVEIANYPGANSRPLLNSQEISMKIQRPANHSSFSTMSPRALACSLAVVMVLTSSAPAANLLSNPSFENPVTSVNYTRLNVGDDIGGAWYVTATLNNVGLVRSGDPAFASLLPYPDGDQIVYVGDSGRGATIAQPIATPLTAGDYNFSFYLGILNKDQPANALIQLAPITGGSGATTTYGAPVFDNLYTIGGPGVLPGWNQITATITVTTPGSYGLLISGVEEPFKDYPTIVDNVVLQSSIPEAGQVWMMALASGLFVIASRRFGVGR